MRTLEYYEAADRINDLADALCTIDKMTDTLFPKLRMEDAERLMAIRELDWINPTLIRRVRDIADIIQEEGDENEAAMVAMDEAEEELVFDSRETDAVPVAVRSSRW